MSKKSTISNNETNNETKHEETPMNSTNEVIETPVVVEAPVVTPILKKVHKQKKHELTCTKCQSIKTVSGPWFYKLVHQHGGKIQLSQAYKCPECNRAFKAEIMEAGKIALNLTSVQA